MSGVIFRNTKDNQCLGFPKGGLVDDGQELILNTCVLSHEAGETLSWSNPLLEDQLSLNKTWTYINTQASDITQLYQIKDKTGEKCLQPNSDNGSSMENSVIMGSCDSPYTTFHKYEYSHTNYLSDWNEGDGVLFPRAPFFYLRYADNYSAYVDGTTNLKGKAVINKQHTDDNYTICYWDFDSVSNVKIDGVDVPAHEFDILKNVTAECFLICRYQLYDSYGNMVSDTPYSFIYDEENNQLVFSSVNGTDIRSIYESIRSESKIFIDLTGKTVYSNNLPKKNNQTLKIGIQKNDDTILYAKVDHRINKMGMILQETDATLFNIIIASITKSYPTELVTILPQVSSNDSNNLASFMNPYKKLYVNGSDNKIMIKGIEDGTGDTTFDFNIVPYNDSS